MRDVRGRVRVEHEFINETAAEFAVPQFEALELDQAFEVDAHLRQTPAAGLAQLAPRKRRAQLRRLAGLRLFRFHEGLDMVEEPPRLRRQFVERAAEDFRRELVRERDVVEGDGNVFHHASSPAGTS